LDIDENYDYEPLVVSLETSFIEVSSTLSSRKSYNALGFDGILYAFLKALGSPFITSLVQVINASWRLGYFPSRYKQAKTVVIRKPSKASYQEPKAWRPIALLCTIGKLIETIIAKRIQGVAKEFRLLPLEQMGFRASRSTESALDLLTSQVQTV
jgi:Reverse transcriptase (RNA-dependent DNA polymerase)